MVRISSRTFGIRFSISGKKLKRMERDGAAARNGLAMLFVTSAFYVPIALCALAIREASPFIREAYEREFEKIGDRSGFYVAVALFAFSIQWCLSELKRARGAIREESYRIAFHECCFAIDRCLRAYEGRVSLLTLDRRNQRLNRALTRFGETDAVGFSSHRKKQLFEHTARVGAALDVYNERILREGTQAIPDLVKQLFIILERMADDRWLALLDEHDLPAYAPPSSEELESEARRTDATIVFGGATVAALFTGIAISLGAPASAVIPAALIFLLGPAAMWGSKKLSNPRETLDAMRQGISPSTEPPQQPAGTSNAPRQ
ncbi:hypothetical protein [Streptomyces longisporoflavus]|uniref:hypothetical protein n=1 Tax=Streptomyces longisporoflavus TaxID=28044 RepID=UPI00167D4CD4|nr:hypothetical protein [Streptomyces longisporoflavus]